MNTLFVVVFTLILISTISAVTFTLADSCDNQYLLSTSNNPQLTTAQINAILKEHNDARRSVAPWSMNMVIIKWSECLATLARQYITTCPGLTHSSSSYRSSKCGYTKVGENLAAGTSSSTYGNSSGGVASTRAWNRERTSNTWSHGCNAFDTAGSCYGAGHYTQVIKASAEYVGCASAYCPSQPYKNYWACHYSAPNYANTQPYTSAGNNRSAAWACTNFTASPGGAAGATSMTSVLFSMIVSMFLMVLFSSF